MDQIINIVKGNLRTMLARVAPGQALDRARQQAEGAAFTLRCVGNPEAAKELQAVASELGKALGETMDRERDGSPKERTPASQVSVEWIAELAHGVKSRQSAL